MHSEKYIYKYRGKNIDMVEKNW